jgi:hypothetical protein
VANKGDKVCIKSLNFIVKNNIRIVRLAAKNLPGPSTMDAPWMYSVESLVRKLTYFSETSPLYLF